MTTPAPAPALPLAGPREIGARIAALVRTHRARLAAILALHLLAVAGGLLAPLLLGRVIDAIAAGEDIALPGWVLAVLAALAGHAVLAYAALRASFLLGERVFATLREDFVAGLLGLPHGQVERAGTGEILSRTTSDLDAVHEVVRIGLPETLVATVTTTMTIAAAVVINPAIALATLVGIPWIALSTRWFVRRAPDAFAADLAASAALATEITETARGADTVRALGLGPRRRRRAHRRVAEARAASRRPVGLQLRWFPLVQVGYHLPLLTTLVWGGWLVQAGHARIGEVAAIAIYLQAVLAPVDDLVYWFGEVQSAGAALARIVGVRPAPATAATGACGVDGSVAMTAVEFAYPGHEPVLTGLDLDIPSGQQVAIVGPSGAGKSTIAALLARLLTPDAGRIRVGGADLAGLARADIAGHVAVVTQEDHVFCGSLAQNLRLAAPNAGDEELRAALAAAGADDWVAALEDGLDTGLGAAAYEPTARESRQLALARVLLRRPRVLVLDEVAGAATDPALAHALATDYAGTTVVHIAHDLESAAAAERVIVVDDGRIVDDGPPEQLLAAGGPYAALWQARRGGQVLAAAS